MIKTIKKLKWSKRIARITFPWAKTDLQIQEVATIWNLQAELLMNIWTQIMEEIQLQPQQKEAILKLPISNSELKELITSRPINKISWVEAYRFKIILRKWFNLKSKISIMDLESNRSRMSQWLKWTFHNTKLETRSKIMTKDNKML